MSTPTGWAFADSWVLAVAVYQRPCSLLDPVRAMVALPNDETAQASRTIGSTARRAPRP